MIQKLILFAALFFLLFVTAAFPQEVEREPQKLDQFGRIAECDFGARLDKLMVTLQENPGYTGAIITYRGADELPSTYDEPADRFIRRQFAFRNFDVSRVTFIDGGFRKSRFTELWIVPPGGDLPMSSDSIPRPTLPKKTTFLFDRQTVDDGYFPPYSSDFDEYLLRHVKAKFDKEREEAEAEKRKVDPDYSRTENNKEFSDEFELADPRFSWFDAKFAAVLARERDFTGVLVYYANGSKYDLNAVRSLIDEARSRMATDAGIPESRIKIHYGGFRYLLEVEFWIKPKAGKFPTATPDDPSDYESEEETDDIS
ncbi:MAG: hypothetical protein KIS76_14810 [Pyrinomonadaceae bacterium]|nr:hypothetical protein [Pyrinomonadaceae bacterium]